MSDARRIEPPESEVAKPFWDATREQRLVLQWCTDCGKAIFYPREVCPSCLRADVLEWRDASGRGEVYAVSVQHAAQVPMPAYEAPYAVAVVELEEGVRMLSTIVGTDPETVVVGQAVTVAWEPLSDGRNLPMFQPS
ncbi:MAG: uncharacterized protein QOG90_2154 [Actinomycetota bacterium]